MKKSLFILGILVLTILMNACTEELVKPKDSTGSGGVSETNPGQFK